MRGASFPVTQSQRAALLALTDPDEILEFLEEIEGGLDSKSIADLDKAWDPIHACLTGYGLDQIPAPEGDSDPPSTYGPHPERLALLGGRRILECEDYHIVRMVEAEDMAPLARTLEGIDEAAMRSRYEALVPDTITPKGPDEEYFEYIWQNFVTLRDLFARTAPSGNAVLFTVHL